MNYEYVWKVLERILLELKKRGASVPPEILDDLKSAQTLIPTYTAEPTALDVASRIEGYLERVESNLIYLASADVSEEYAEECLNRIQEARLKGLMDVKKVASRFVSGVPRGDHWIRINVSDLIGGEELRRLVEEQELSTRTQEDDYILVHGSEDRVKAFVKKIGERLRRRRASG